MDRDLQSALIEALDLLEQGTPVVRILANYPEMAEELRPFLVTAVDLNRTVKPAPAAAQEASKHDFLQYAAGMQNERRRPAATWLGQLLRGSLAFLLFLFLGTTVLVFMSDEALPGDALYGAKLFVEGQQLNYSANPAASAALIDDFRQERVDEVTELLALGRQEMISFDGEIEEMAPERWLVEGIPVAIISSTGIHDGVEVGFLVRITGETANGAVFAQQVEVLDGRLPEPDLDDPAPSLKPSPTQTPTAEPVNTPQKPDILQPDDGSESPAPQPLPSATITAGDDLPGGDGGEPGDDEAPPGIEDGEGAGDQQEQDDTGGSLEGDPSGDQIEDEGEEGENSGEDSGDESAGEDSGDEDGKEDRGEEDGGEEDGGEEDGGEEDGGEEDGGEESDSSGESGGDHGDEGESDSDSD